MKWHSESVERVMEALETDSEGLSTDEVERRREEYGPNEIAEEDEVSPLSIFLNQFRGFLVYLLVFAVVLSLGVGFLPGEQPEYTDAALILAILVGNGIFGFVQDYRAERSIEALRKLATPEATVRRDGEKRTVDARELVPGDVVFIEQGDAVPADARLVQEAGLETNESALTGESSSVSKSPEPVDEDAAIADRANMLYMNTTAVRGRGTAVVVGTGMDTEIGGIATQIREAEERKTPFEHEVDELGKRIGIGVVVLILLVAGTQFAFTAADPILVLLVAITLAVAAVPEGLPAVVTLTLALGSRKMVQKNALVRKLSVVESLGSVDVIVTDKTGTLTENRMTVTRLATPDEVYEVSGTGTNTDGEFYQDDEVADTTPVEDLLRCGAVCNNAERQADGEYRGDPTEIALLVSASKARVEADYDRLAEVPFSSERQRMTVVVDEDEPTAYMKGAPETVLDRCDRIRVGDDVVELTDERREAVMETVATFTGDALRVLGFATRPGVDPDPDPDEDALEREMVFLGVQGMLDPPRDGVAEAVADCRKAGIRVVMATGDDVRTAKAIGEQIGFDPEGAMEGRELADVSDDEIGRVVEETDVFARVAPDHKVRILQALQGNDHIVAMTGDGVNDAPALRNADVGVSMGQRGTQVAQQASDMVLQDDNFVTIRDAIAEGRGIFDNIRKFVNYLLSANAGEVLVVFVGVLVGTFFFPEQFAFEEEALILTPVMLLWLNLVTDGLPALALGVDPKAEGIMSRSPRRKGESILNVRAGASILGIGLVMTLTGLSLFFFGLERAGELVRAQTLLFTFLVTVELVRTQVIRMRYGLSLLSNRWLLAALATSLALQLAVLYTPLRVVFEVVPLTSTEWGWIGVAFVGFLVANVLLTVVFDRGLGSPTDRERSSAD